MAGVCAFLVIPRPCTIQFGMNAEPQRLNANIPTSLSKKKAQENTFHIYFYWPCCFVFLFTGKSKKKKRPLLDQSKQSLRFLLKLVANGCPAVLGTGRRTPGSPIKAVAEWRTTVCCGEAWRRRSCRRALLGLVLRMRSIEAKRS